MGYLNLESFEQHAFKQQGAYFGPPIVHDSHIFSDRYTTYGGNSVPLADPHTIIVVIDFE